MREVDALEAKNKLGQLLDLVERGEEIIITRRGKEVARLVPLQKSSTASRNGRPSSASASAPRSSSSGLSSGPNGNRTGMKGDFDEIRNTPHPGPLPTSGAREWEVRVEFPCVGIGGAAAAGGAVGTCSRRR